MKCIESWVGVEKQCLFPAPGGIFFPVVRYFSEKSFPGNPRDIFDFVGIDMDGIRIDPPDEYRADLVFHDTVLHEHIPVRQHHPYVLCGRAEFVVDPSASGILVRFVRHRVAAAAVRPGERPGLLRAAPLLEEQLPFLIEEEYGKSTVERRIHGMDIALRHRPEDGIVLVDEHDVFIGWVHTFFSINEYRQG